MLFLLNTIKNKKTCIILSECTAVANTSPIRWPKLVGRRRKPGTKGTAAPGRTAHTFGSANIRLALVPCLGRPLRLSAVLAIAPARRSEIVTINPVSQAWPRAHLSHNARGRHTRVTQRCERAAVPRNTAAARHVAKVARDAPARGRRPHRSVAIVVQKERGLALVARRYGPRVTPGGYRGRRRRSDDYADLARAAWS